MSGLGGALSVFFGVTVLAALEMVEMLIVLIVRLMSYFFGCRKRENTPTFAIKSNIM